MRANATLATQCGTRLSKIDAMIDAYPAKGAASNLPDCPTLKRRAKGVSRLNLSQPLFYRDRNRQR